MVGAISIPRYQVLLNYLRLTGWCESALFCLGGNRIIKF
jgi:hypothetical protein